MEMNMVNLLMSNTPIVLIYEVKTKTTLSAVHLYRGNEDSSDLKDIVILGPKCDGNLLGDWKDVCEIIIG